MSNEKPNANAASSTVNSCSNGRVIVRQFQMTDGVAVAVGNVIREADGALRPIRLKATGKVAEKFEKLVSSRIVNGESFEDLLHSRIEILVDGTLSKEDAPAALYDAAADVHMMWVLNVDKVISGRPAPKMTERPEILRSKVVLAINEAMKRSPVYKTQDGHIDISHAYPPAREVDQRPTHTVTIIASMLFRKGYREFISKISQADALDKAIAGLDIILGRLGVGAPAGPQISETIQPEGPGVDAKAA